MSSVRSSVLNSNGNCFLTGQGRITTDNGHYNCNDKG